jgi:hypothetical protein
VKRFEKVRRVATTGLVALVAAGLAYGASNVISSSTESPKFQLLSGNGFTITSSVKATYVSATSCIGPTTGPTAVFYPGVTRCLVVTVHNPLAVPLHVTTLAMVVASFTPASTTLSLPACTTTMVTPPTFTSTVPFTVAAHGTHGVNKPISLSTSGNQDNCENGTFHFTYSGSATYTDSTTTVLTTAPNPSLYGHPVLLTAKVTAADAGVDPTSLSGTVTFYACTTVSCSTITRTLGTAGVDGLHGRATTYISTLPVGTTYIEAKYTGTTKFATSTSNVVTQVVRTTKPTLTKVTPSAGKVAGGTVITLTGTNFRTGTTTVTFGAGSPGTTVVVSSPTTLTVKAPPHAVGTVTVTATTPTGTSNALPYRYAAVPTISTLSRTGPPAGYNWITITGSGFTGTTSVKFGTLTALQFTVVSNVQIRAVAPPHAAGPVRISVTTPGGTSASTPSDIYNYVYPVPAVSGVSPKSGPASGGTLVTVTGSGFTGVSAVWFGTTKVTTTITLVSSRAGNSVLTVKSPAGVSGTTVDIKVVTPGGTSSAVAVDHFTYGPVITSLSRSTGPVAGGTKVTITGHGFTTVQHVKFGTATAKSFTVNSSSQIVATTAAHAAGQVRVSVTTAAGLTPATTADLYTFK